MAQLAAELAAKLAAMHNGLFALLQGGDRANFTQIHHQNFDKSFLGVKLHYIFVRIPMDLYL